MLSFSDERDWASRCASARMTGSAASVARVALRFIATAAVPLSPLELLVWMLVTTPSPPITRGQKLK